MTTTATTLLLYLVALFLTVATLWIFLSDATRTIRLKETEPQFFWLLIIVILPFVMLIYFGFAFIISDTINFGAVFQKEEEPAFSEGFVVAVCYVGLSGWLWVHWRYPIAPTKILGPSIIAMLIVFITVDVIWAAHHDHIFEWLCTINQLHVGQPRCRNSSGNLAMFAAILRAAAEVA